MRTVLDLGGLVALTEGDYVFARDITKGGDPAEDALQIFVATQCVFIYALTVA